MPTPDPTLLITRPRAASERFRAQCEAQIGRRIPTIIAPVVAIEPVGTAPDLARFGGVIFTSGHAVEMAGQGAGQTAYCVGARTAELATAMGFAAQSADGNAEALLHLITNAAPRTPLVHLRGERSRGDIAKRLSAAGIATEDHITYRQTMQSIPDDALATIPPGSELILPVFSPFSATALSRTLPVGVFDLTVIAISDAAAKAAPKPAREIYKVPHPNAAAMAEQVAALYRARAAC